MKPTEQPVAPQTVIGGRFVVERLAGSGGMGSVYAATDQATGDRVALKIGAPGADLARFEEEARVLERLAHPAIVRHIAHGIDGGALFLAMEWLDGEDLATMCARARLPVAEVVAIAR